MALATPVEKHMAESALPSLRNVKHVLSQHTGSGSTHSRNTLLREVLPLLLEAKLALCLLLCVCIMSVNLV